jgi:hypothetical protein
MISRSPEQVEAHRVSISRTLLGSLFWVALCAGCTGSTPGLGVSGRVSYEAVCLDDDACVSATEMHSVLDIPGATDHVGVSPCLLGQYYHVPAGDGWLGVYVSPDGTGDGQSPSRPMSIDSVPEADKLYVSLLPGTYSGLHALVEKV